MKCIPILTVVAVLLASGCQDNGDLTRTFGDSGLSHFLALGFDTSADMGELSKTVAEKGKPIETETAGGGQYHRLAYKDGLELWTYVKDGKAEDMKPFFRGGTGNRVKIMRNISDPSGKDKGAFQGWVQLVEADGTTKEAYPFVFECPAYNIHSKTQFPRTVNLYVAAYATGIKLYQDDKAYLLTQAGSSPKSFSQSGGFTSQSPPISSFTGVIKDTKIVKNPLTGLEFRWMSVETYGMTVDVLAEDKTLPAPPQIGNVATISAWFSGDWG
jgi:hypothetical protein